MSGPDELMSTKTQIIKLKTAKSQGVGSDIKISKTQGRKAIKQGGSLRSSLISLGTRALLYATSAISKAVPALATGAMSALGSLGIDKIFGKGDQQGGFLIPQNKLEQLIKYKHLLSAGQKKQILDSLQTGGRLVIRPTRKQIEGALGAILVSIVVPLAIELASKLFGKGLNISRKSVPAGSSRGSRGLQVSQKPGMLMPYQTPPFLGTWENPVGMGVKKTQRARGLLQGKQPIQRNSAFRNNPVKLPLRDIPLSNIDLQNLYNHLNIKIKGMFSRNTHMSKLIAHVLSILMIIKMQEPIG